MIDDRAITEARSRLRNKAQNEQTSVTFSELLRIAEQENKQLREENERLRGWIRVEGGCNNTCTRKILGEICRYCRCPQSKIDAARSAK